MKAGVRHCLWGACLVGMLALTPFRLLRVTGHSMEPTLRDGEVYVLDALYWRTGGLHRKDIVAVRHGGETWVKRLVGMPGDHLQIGHRDDGWITQVRNLTTDPGSRRDDDYPDDRTVQPDEIFVMGDNLNRSSDSTTQEQGAFHPEDIQGVVRRFSLARDFPFQHHQ